MLILFNLLFTGSLPTLDLKRKNDLFIVSHYNALEKVFPYIMWGYSMISCKARQGLSVGGAIKYIACCVFYAVLNVENFYLFVHSFMNSRVGWFFLFSMQLWMVQLWISYKYKLKMNGMHVFEWKINRVMHSMCTLKQI